MFGAALIAVTAWVMQQLRPRLRGKLEHAIATAIHVYERLAADLAVAQVDQQLPIALAESERLLDVLAGQLATLTAVPHEPDRALAIEGLRDETDMLRRDIEALCSEAAFIPALERTGQRLIVFESAVRRLRQSVATA